MLVFTARLLAVMAAWVSSLHSTDQHSTDQSGTWRPAVSPPSASAPPRPGPGGRCSPEHHNTSHYSRVQPTSPSAQSAASPTPGSSPAPRLHSCCSQQQRDQVDTDHLCLVWVTGCILANSAASPATLCRPALSDTSIK